MKYNSLRRAAQAIAVGLIVVFAMSCSNKDYPAPLPEGVHEAVDMGLPSGTKWASTNIGAYVPHQIGLYFAWGETVGYTGDPNDGRNFYFEDYKWHNNPEYIAFMGTTKYQVPDTLDGKNGHPRGCWYDKDGNFIGDNKTELDPEDDAARVLWGNGWRMPTRNEVGELCKNCDFIWETIDGMVGVRLTSKINGNSLFFPACGDRGNGEIHWVGQQGYYWSSTVDVTNTAYACYLVFSSYGVYPWSSWRFGGRNIRPVINDSENK
jgi:hypothetical protein